MSYPSTHRYLYPSILNPYYSYDQNYGEKINCKIFFFFFSLYIAGLIFTLDIFSYRLNMFFNQTLCTLQLLATFGGREIEGRNTLYATSIDVFSIKQWVCVCVCIYICIVMQVKGKTVVNLTLKVSFNLNK